MKVINQNGLALMKVKNLENSLLLIQGSLDIIINKHGAKQLIEILKEFVGANDDRLLTTDENGNCTHFHTTFGRGECFDCGKKLK